MAKAKRRGRERPHDHDEVARILAEWRVERPDLDPTPMGVLGRITRVAALQRAGLTRLVDRFGLTPASFDVLANLRRSPAPHRKTPGELAASSMISSGGITFRLDRLEADGLVHRVRSEHDRRVWFAELTPAGVGLIDEAVEAHLAREHAILGVLDEEERDDLARALAVLERRLAAAGDATQAAAVADLAR